MAQAVRVNVSEHATKILSELHRMRQGCNHCDFIIKVENDVYRTHKNVLSAGSEYFRAMLEHDTKESRDGVITFKDVDSECVKNCVDFIYSGEFEIPSGKMKDLLHVGIMLQLDGLKTATAEVLAESINVGNYYWTTNIADMYALVDVLTKCQRFFEENLMEIANQPEFGNMPLSKLSDFLLSSGCKYSEEQKLTILLRWGEKNAKANSNLLESLRRFKLETVSSTFLINLLKADPVVSNDMTIYKFFNIHLIENLENKVKINEESKSQELKPIGMNRGDTGRNVAVDDKPSISMESGSESGSNTQHRLGFASVSPQMQDKIAWGQVQDDWKNIFGEDSKAQSSSGVLCKDIASNSSLLLALGQNSSGAPTKDNSSDSNPFSSLIQSSSGVPSKGKASGGFVFSSSFDAPGKDAASDSNPFSSLIQSSFGVPSKGKPSGGVVFSSSFDAPGKDTASDSDPFSSLIQSSFGVPSKGKPSGGFVFSSSFDAPGKDTASDSSSFLSQSQSSTNVPSKGKASGEFVFPSSFGTAGKDTASNSRSFLSQSQSSTQVPSKGKASGGFVFPSSFGKDTASDSGSFLSQSQSSTGVPSKGKPSGGFVFPSSFGTAGKDTASNSRSFLSQSQSSTNVPSKGKASVGIVFPISFGTAGKDTASDSSSFLSQSQSSTNVPSKGKASSGFVFPSSFGKDTASDSGSFLSQIQSSSGVPSKSKASGVGPVFLCSFGTPGKDTESDSSSLLSQSQSSSAVHGGDKATDSSSIP